MPREMYDKIRASPDTLEFVVTIVDFKTGQAEYRSSREVADYEQMVNWMWASGNEPLFMSYYEVGDHAYVDGGVMENVPLKYALRYAIDHKLEHVDVIINKPLDPILDKEFAERKVLKGLNRIIEFFTLEIRNDDLFIPQLQAEVERCRRENGGSGPATDAGPSINIYFYYFPGQAFNGLYVKELLFDQQRMKTLWDLGYAGTRDGQPAALKVPAPLKVPVRLLEELLKRP